jgi:hypothetical protein
MARQVGRKLKQTGLALFVILEAGLLIGGASLIGDHWKAYEAAKRAPKPETPSTLELATGKVVQLSDDQLEGALRAGTHTLPKDYRLPVVTEFGQEGTVSAADATEALRDLHYRYQTVAERSVPVAFWADEALVGLGYALTAAALLGVFLWASWLLRPETK